MQQTEKNKPILASGIQKATKKLKHINCFGFKVALFYEQMEGLAAGWQKASLTTGHSLGDYGFL